MVLYTHKECQALNRIEPVPAVAPSPKESGNQESVELLARTRRDWSRTRNKVFEGGRARECGYECAFIVLLISHENIGLGLPSRVCISLGLVCDVCLTFRRDFPSFRSGGERALKSWSGNKRVELGK